MLTLYINNIGHDLHPMATCADLYSLIDSKLYYLSVDGHQMIHNNAVMLCDLGISNEMCISMIPYKFINLYDWPGDKRIHKFFKKCQTFDISTCSNKNIEYITLDDIYKIIQELIILSEVKYDAMSVMDSFHADGWVAIGCNPRQGLVVETKDGTMSYSKKSIYLNLLFLSFITSRKKK